MATDFVGRVRKALEEVAYPVQAYLVPGDVTRPCPCTNNPWNQYSEAWHLEHPEAPNCHRTGYLTELADSDTYFELATIQAVVIPHFAYVGRAIVPMESGMSMKWEWLGVTQDSREFNRLITPFGMRFVIQNTMPYYVGGDGTTLAACIYGLLPVNFDVPIP